MRSRFLLFILLFSAVSASLFAQDIDYLKHRKTFDICSIKKRCSHCFDCEKERYIVKIQSKADKQITGVYYKYYSPVFNKIVEKEAKIVGNKIPAKAIGEVYVCVLDVRHWIFSKVEYADGSAVTFTLNDRMENFIQEADECDCNE